MPSNWVTIDKFGLEGLQSDLVPAHRAPGSLDIATNCRVIGSNIEQAGGYVSTGVQALDSNTLFHQSVQGESFRFMAGEEGTSLYRIDDFWPTNITGEAINFRRSPDQYGTRWSGGQLNATMTFNRGGDPRNFVQGVDSVSQKLKWDVTDEDDPSLTWQETDNAAYVMRPYLNFMFAGYMYEPVSETERPQRVHWSHPVEYRERPEIWAPKADNLAGFVDLGQSSGQVVDMVPLRSSLIIYKTDSIWICDYIGGNEVFRFREAMTSKGIVARDCVAEYNGTHYCLGGNDIFTFDGNTVTSILWGKARKVFVDTLDLTKAGNNFVTLDNLHGDILFHYCDKSSSDVWPRLAMAYNVYTQAWTTRDYSTPLRHSTSVKSLPSARSSSDDVLTLDDVNLYTLEQGSMQGEIPILTTIRRTGLLADPGHNWAQVDAVKIGLATESLYQHTAGDITFSLGGQVCGSAPITWRSSFDFDPTTDYKLDARQNDNYIAFEIIMFMESSWQLSNIDLQVQGSGKRG